MSEAHDAKQWAKCVKVGDAWVDARGELPALCAVWYAQSLLGVGRYNDALRWAHVAVGSIPASEKLGMCAAKGCYAQILAARGDYMASRKILREMIRVPQGDPEAQEKMAHVALAVSDDWRRGWTDHEARLRNTKRPFPANCRPWDGVTQEPVAVLHEQGIGDAVLAARWLPWLERASGYVPTWYGPSLLHRWIGSLAGVGSIDDAENNTEPMAAVYALSLPYYAGVKRPQDVPNPVAPSALIEQRRNRPANERIRVGVCWKGADWGWHNFERSFKPYEWAPIVEPVDGVEFVNLCHMAEVPETWPFPMTGYSDIYHTGEVMTTLDLVVSVDTAVVHLAGSLNVPTIAILPTKVDWRYRWPFGNTTPFYDSVTTIRRRSSDNLECIAHARFLLGQYVTSYAKERAA